MVDTSSQGTRRPASKCIPRPMQGVLRQQHQPKHGLLDNWEGQRRVLAQTLANIKLCRKVPLPCNAKCLSSCALQDKLSSYGKMRNSSKSLTPARAPRSAWE